MNPVVNELSASIKDRNDEKIKENLQAIVSQGKNIEIENVDVFKTLFHSTSNETLRLTSEAIAELAKTEPNRKVLTNRNVTKCLLNLLTNDEDVIVQTCRALGNICFENDEARQLVHQEGLLKLIDVIKRYSSGTNFKLLNVACGFLLNLLMNNEELQKCAIKNNIISVTEEVLKKACADLENNEDCCTHILLTLNILTEHLVDVQLSEEFCCLLVEVLKISKNPEISVICLELLHVQLENNDVKLLLAKKGVCELVFELVEQYKHQVDDEDTRAALKMACDVIVLILTGDEPMDILYGNGDGIVFKNMLTWLNSEDFDLQSTGILAIGNFARNDAHCTQMVQNGIAKKLLDLLSKINTIEKNVKVQHAILSALRNLVILPQNKAQILQEGLVPILYPMLDVDHSHVTFKLLGTLRIVIDGQEQAALDLIMKDDLLRKIVDWSYNSDHLGVRGEASRFLAWLIKHCHSSKPYNSILQTKDCVKCLVDMISSNHAVMQNEAFYALTLLCIDRLGNSHSSSNAEDYNKLDKILVEAGIGKNLSFIINKYKEKLEKETIVNLLTLIEHLVKSPLIVQHLNESQLNERLSQLQDNKKAVEVHEKIKELRDAIDIG
ncbi:hypothetical protein RN001_015207 [Aquatica leii]|uniref:Rap1 GTPase-GDP dissociation stimulator 1 n=1 Tax=Aquatica leii TaxID=1421715 RepID=A0AAN7SL11_9COLE|nr:hypothetical protein RN001_015207 [Aquatica leii]